MLTARTGAPFSRRSVILRVYPRLGRSTDRLWPQINGVKEYLDEHDHSDEDGVEDDPYDDSSPALLLGTGRVMTKEDVLVDIPPRSIADRLVSRFLKTSEPSLGEFPAL